MKKFICDICKVSVTEYKLKTLYNHLKISEPPNGDIFHVCPDCDSKICEAQSKIEDALKPIKISWIKGIILKLRKKHSET